jgi:hypothetical protein
MYGPAWAMNDRAVASSGSEDFFVSVVKRYTAVLVLTTLTSTGMRRSSRTVGFRPSLVVTVSCGPMTSSLPLPVA